MSDNEDSWSFKDLSIYWPLHDVSGSLPPRYSSKSNISGPDEFGGYSFRESCQGGHRSWSIPDHYANPLAIITAKIIWLQIFRSRNKHYKKIITSKITSEREQQSERLAKLQEGCARTLVFTMDVRRVFLLDLSYEYYDKSGVPRRKWTKEDEAFRSKHLDSWLYAEFAKAAHHPPTYVTIHGDDEDDDIDPLRLSLDGKVTSDIN
jgi:hypothetical protein